MTTTDPLYSEYYSYEEEEEAFDFFVPETDFFPAATHRTTTVPLSSIVLTEEEDQTDHWRKTVSEPNDDDLIEPVDWSDVESLKTKKENKEIRMEETGFFEISNHLPGAYELRISNACRQLNILNNPLLWTDEDVRSWCDWALGLYQVHPTRRRTLLNNITLSGTSFSRLEPKDFERLFHSAGVYVFAELELWKNATEITSTRLLLSTELMSINQTATGVTMSSTTEDNCQWSADHRVSLDSKPIEVNERSSMVTPGDGASTNSSESMTDCHSWWNNIPTVVMYSELDDEEEGPRDDDGDPLRDLGDGGVSRSGGALAGEGQGRSNAPTDCDQRGRDHRAEEETVVNKASQLEHHSDYATVEAMRGGGISSRDDDDDWQTYSKQGHHLWQFLQELLQRPLIYENCIRWIDRRQGIFKIGDSMTVAKLWGQRKNRPAMNYDKLSRSIRQYYKKGIIRKTSGSKRLVYQFCPKYNI